MFIYSDNFLNESEIFEIENIFKSSDNKWTYSPTTIQHDHYNYTEIISEGDFQDSQYFSLSPEKGTRAYELAEMVANKFIKHNNLNSYKIPRIRFNITPITDKSITTYPHVDSQEPHLIMLYYVNDCKGDTILYDQKYNGSKINETTIMKRITPKRGAAFLTDGHNFHSIAIPNSGDLRKVINFNLILP